ncbi:LPD38 domain-containing protein [Bacteroides heparinolyticus]|uniref:LPD38 domain-containing protein n=1 Tax=Prevotella heparinolytica TaxID=28113 RepID=UPI00359FDEED
MGRLSELFHTPVQVHYSLETIQNATARKAAEDGLAKGWYVDGEVHIYLPNATGVEDIQETFFHEVVAHKGVKEMLGDKHNELLNALFDVLPEVDQKRLLELYGEKHVAADEYLAELAERGGFESKESRGIISKIVDVIREFLSRYHIQIGNPTAEEIAHALLKESAARLTEKRKEADAPKFNGDILAYARDLNKRNQLREAAKDVNKSPSKAQQDAGNYKKAHVNVQGFDITIENPKGSTRSGVDESGKAWSITMQNDYGYFKRSEGKDGDQIDVFIGNNPESGKIFVVDQVNPETGVFDESKVMLGFNSKEEAKNAYLSNYEEGWQGLGSITETDAEYFKEWLYDGKKQRKAFSEYKDVSAKNKPRKTFREIIDSANEREAKERLSGWFESVMSEQQLPEERTKSNIKGVPEEFVSDDQTRPVLSGIYHSNGVVYASDGFILISEEKKYPRKDEGVVKSKGMNIKGKYPSVENVIPKMDVYSEFDTGRLVSFVERVETALKSEWNKRDGSGKRIDPRTYKVKRSNTYVVLRANGEDVVVRFDQLEKIAKAANRLGINRIGTDASRIHLAKGNNNLLVMRIDLMEFLKNHPDEEAFAYDLTGDNSGEGGVRFRMSDEESRIKERAISDGTFMKAPNGRPTKLNEHQWLQVRTDAFKKWFGDWEKSARIEKLRKAKPVEITGKEVKPSDDLKQYKKNALEYGKTLRGEYTNKDTGEKIAIGKRGVKEVLQHDYKDREHLQSIAAIPQIIENSIYIDTLPNEDVDKNPDVKAYQYYVSGLKIGGEDYTARAAIAVDSQGNRYYDHKLTDIEKGELLNAMVGITNPVSQKTSPPSGYKDTKLVSLLQTNSSKVVDENGEPLVVYHGTREDGFSIFDDMEGNKLSDAPEGVSFFTDMKSVAYTYSGRYDRPHYELEEDEEGVGSIYEVFLNIRDPRFEDFGGAGWDGQAWGKAALLDEENIEVYPNDGRRFFDSLSEAEDFAQEYDYQNYYVQKDPSVGYTTNEIAEEAMADGNDGAIFYDVVDVGSYGAEQESTVYVTFHPSQIKSATDNTGAFNEKNNDIRFRLSDGPVVDTEDLKKGIRRENRFQRTMDKFQEAYQDTYLPVKRLYERIEAQGVKVEDWENFYAQATHIPGKNQAEIEVYTSKYMNPMIEQVKVLKDKGFSYREIENYVMLKHGKERNEYMRERESAKYLKKHPRATAAKIDELKSKDYAGVRDIAKEVGDLGDIPEIGTAERIAAKFVHDVEVLCGDEAIGSFWDAVTAATRFSLTKSYHSGILSKAGYDELVSRYKYYVPLRGHDAITAEDKWDYISESGSPTFSSPIKRAKGRSTRAESPFAFIFQTAQSSIMAGNKNRLKSTLLNLAESGKAGTLFNISKSWYEKAGTDEQGNDAWQLAVPKYDEDPVVYSENIVNFEKRMKEEAKKGNAVQSRRKLDLDGMFIKPHQAAEHEIHIRRNGEDLVLYINADPALARSVNGANRVISDSRFMHGARWSTRQIAAMSTSLNPLFTASNFMRDLQYSVVKLGAEKGGKFTAGYSVRLGRILFKDRVLIRMLNGQLDLSKKYDQYAYEFLMNGGKTGYVSALNLETTAHRIEKELKRLGVRELSALNPAKEAYLAGQCTRAMGDFFVTANEFAENSIRLAAYITARENGESIVSSVNTAKEVTVNFNRRGSGAMGADAINSLFMFTNVAFQALDNFAKIAKKHKWKLAATMAAYMLSGFLQSWWIDVFGSDDSKEAYWGTSDWDRQNNLCIPIGRGLFKIPHPQELRALRGLGVGIYQSIKGTKAPEDTVLDLLSAVADVVPMGSTFVPAEVSVSGVVTAVSPTVLQPVTQWVANMNFKGNPVRNAYASEYAPGHLQARTNRKGQPRADRWIYDLCEFINVSVGRGDGAKKGWIDLNPDAVQHFAGGYFGGLFNTASSTVNTIYMAQNGEAVRELRIRDTPLRRFYAETADMNNVDSGTMSKFYDISDKADQAHYMFGRYKKQLQDKSLTQEEYREKIEALNYPYWESIRDELSAIRRLERRLKDVAEDEQVKLDMKSAEMKRQLVKRYEKDMEVKHEE